MTSLRLACSLVLWVGCAKAAVTDPDETPRDAMTATLDASMDGSTDADVQSLLDATEPVARLDAGLDASEPAANPDGAVPDPTGNLATRMLTVGTTMRSYLLYVPRGLDATQALPLVSVHHPSGQDDQYMVELTTWRQIADRERFVVVFPEGGSGNPWNIGEGACSWGGLSSAPATQDDMGFVRAIVTDVASVQAIDTKRVFVTGLSMGGFFANHVGCQARDVVRAVAAHSGGTYAGACPGEPVPVLLIHGDADGYIPLSCAKDALGYWATRNGCSTSSSGESIKLGQCQWNTGCPAGREIGLCTLKGMDHGWAGAPVTGGWLDSKYGGGVQYENAAELIWKFFKKYR